GGFFFAFIGICALKCAGWLLEVGILPRWGAACCAATGSGQGRCWEQDGARFGVAGVVDGDDDGVTDLKLTAQGGFEIFGINVEAGWSDDDVFLAAAEVEITFGVEFADVAGVQPLGVGGGLQHAGLPVAGGDIFATNEDFAVFGEFELAAGENFADGALGGAERMIEADEGGGFGH